MRKLIIYHKNCFFETVFMMSRLNFKLYNYIFSQSSYILSIAYIVIRIIIAKKKKVITKFLMNYDQKKNFLKNEYKELI